MRSITWGSVIKATMRMVCPQRGHSRGSTSKMRCNNSAQRWRASCSGTGDKPSGLSDNDYAHIKRHPTIGATILQPLTELRAVVEYVRSHHEHWDGSGYPDGLKGEDIPKRPSVRRPPRLGCARSPGKSSIRT